MYVQWIFIFDTGQAQINSVDSIVMYAFLSRSPSVSSARESNFVFSVVLCQLLRQKCCKGTWHIVRYAIFTKKKMNKRKI
jgi:hypothetical protein